LHNVAAECGASDYLLKPFPMSELTSLVRKYAGPPDGTST
jgi:DNA-binding response OmpR family regulator